MLFKKETILLVALLPLSVAAVILHTYMKIYNESCFEDKMTLKCSFMLASYAMAVITTLAINLCQLPRFHGLQRLWFLRRGHRGVKAFGFCLGVVSCIPVNFTRPITNPVIFAALLMVVWGFLVDIATDLDLGLSGILSGMLVGIGIVPVAPLEFPTSRKNDDVGLLIAFGLILGVILMLMTDWVKRKLNIVQPNNNVVGVEYDDVDIHLQTRLTEETKRSEEECNRATSSQLKRNEALLKKDELEYVLKQNQKDLDNKRNEWDNLMHQLSIKNTHKRAIMGEIEAFSQYLTSTNEKNQARQSRDSVVMEGLSRDISMLMKQDREIKQALSKSRQAEQLARDKLSGLHKEKVT